jgi:hypothetical protein
MKFIIEVYTGMEQVKPLVVLIDFYKRFWVVHQP